MVSKQEMTIKSSTDHDEAVEETLIIDGEEANVRREKVKMEKVREENERLKLTLSQMMKNYQSLKMQINGITEEHQSKKPTNPDSMDNDSELVCLSLGRSSKRKEIKKNSSSNSNSNSSEETRNLDGTELGLNWKLDLEKNSAEDSRNLKPADESSLDESLSKEEGSKKNSRNEDEDILQQNLVKKPRVSVRAVINTQTMHDGCQWRKYGQKIAKGNPCPRAYYRCTVTSSCPVRKQVQRCIEDMSILVTTYEGSHNHPLSAAAATMASATSAAAAMLSCGSTTTSPPPNNPNFFFPSSNPINSNTLARATISTSQSHPTVILDLTPPKPTTKFSSTFNFSSSFDPTKTGSWETRFPTINSLAPSSTPLFSTIQTQPANDHKVSAAAITQDPTFQSALAAAISSFVAKNNGMNFHLMNFSQPSSTSNNASVGCGTTFINRYPKPQQKSFKHFAPFTLSGSKSQVLSLADEGEQIKL